MDFEIIGLDHVQLAMPAEAENEAEAFSYAGLCLPNLLGFCLRPQT